jgi:type VI secretion system protein ImpL
VAEGDPKLVGVGGTRYCDWWFAEEAVLLDTAGRYVAHETRAKADIHAGTIAWHGFLKLLKEHRPKRPLNGAIVTLNVMDLLLWSKPERQHFGAHVRMRLAELYAGLDTRFPVYLMVTKMDLLAGFAEFFESYDAKAREQVWGTTFELGADPLALSKSFAGDFEQLMSRLYAEMLARLEEETDLARRAAIYRFPQQFHALGSLLSEFIALAFTTSVDHHSLMLRGAYFTSATQTGKPVDRVMRTLERAFKLKPREVEAAGASGHGYFLGRLMREVILPESVLAVSGELPGRSSPPLAL